MSESYKGHGTLIADSEEFPCRFDLQVYLDRGLKTGSGVIVAESAALWSAFKATKSRVRMADGRSFPIILKSVAFGSDQTPFLLAGAIVDAEN